MRDSRLEPGTATAAPKFGAPGERPGLSPGHPGFLATSLPRRDYWRRRLLATADVCALLISFEASAALVPGGENAGRAFVWALALVPVWMLILKLYGLYDRDLKRVSHSTVDDIPWLFHALITATLVSWVYFRFSPAGKPILEEVVVFFALAMVSMLVARSLVRRVSRRVLGPERVLLIGDDGLTETLVRKMRAHREYGLEPVGVVGVAGSSGRRASLPVLGGIDQLESVVRRHGVNRVLISTGFVGGENEQLDLLRRSRDLGLKVSLLPKPFDAMGPSVEVDDLEGVTVLGLNPPVLSRSSRFIKRGMDLAGASALLFLIGPLMLILVLVVRTTSPGPALFRQRRIGRHGQAFTLWKFRTMYVDAEDRAEGLRALSKDPDWLNLEHDPRITPVGRFLRRVSLDELPQLWNVVRGDMSIVGPRPLIESEDQRVERWGRRRLELTPGITGLWQVLGRTNIPFEEMVKLDYLYVANWSVWGDVRLILRTLPVVLSRRGAN
jgi:exopolysaccharide biosynthesis polyprenyl glycosylphosphotransferase